MTREEILKEAEKHFFAAMLKGWAAGMKGFDVPGMPGHKKIEYWSDNCNGDDIFRVVDCYCVSGAGKSHGTTTIFHFSEPVWVMDYSGCYLKEVIPFIKQALMFQYRKGEFLGGRGPRSYCKNDEEYTHGLHYENLFKSGHSSFSDFTGYERVINSGAFRGEHRYSGMALILTRISSFLSKTPRAIAVFYFIYGAVY